MFLKTQKLILNLLKKFKAFFASFNKNRKKQRKDFNEWIDLKAFFFSYVKRMQSEK